jgi:hypothetical protein
MNITDQKKVCITCKREFSNRKSWESRGIWLEVKYCSKACNKFKDNITYKNRFKNK